MTTKEKYDIIRDVIPIGRMGAYNPRVDERQTLYGDVLDWLRDNGYGKDEELAAMIIGNHAISVNWCGTIDVPLRDGRQDDSPVAPKRCEEVAGMEDAFLSSLDNVSAIRRQIEDEEDRLLRLLIVHIAGTNNAVCFDETTGFVHFHDHATHETFCIIAVRVTDKMAIEFNDAPDEESETGLDETRWFTPGSRGNEGDYSAGQLISCLRTYARAHRP